MRIIAGEFRGRKLLPPEGQETTRPITDRVKQSLFDMLALTIEGAMVYDCFSGTGSLGLESLSRGAKHVTFFERDRSALGRLKQNIEALKVQDRIAVVAHDIFMWMGKPETSAATLDVDLVFLDPPYRFLRERADELQRLADAIGRHHLATKGVIVFRHDARDRLELPSLVRYDEREYGGMTLEFLRKAND
ncbi:MAG TPA: 16S rRNA (guanine(966)-N(2))-methyltransferase RsmD [Tepidisphaeraceae bacterium]|jgi:16S rRNA (guanine966-N2)-methyltransferase